MTRTPWIALSLFAASSMATSAARPVAKAEHPAGQDRPDEAVRYRLLDLKDEAGFIPPDGLMRARQHVDLMRAEEGSRRSAVEPIAGITPGSWTWLGPGNVGGRLRAIVIHPTTPATMWVGSVGGGIWKTTNSGTSWSPVDDFMANLAVSSMIIDPTDSNVMYAGTGEGFFNADAIRGAGIFKSTNGGTNWSQLANTANSSFYFVNRVAISPDGNTLLAATGSGIFRSVNDGANWTQVHATRTLDVDFDPTNSSKAIGGRGDGKAVWSNDGGVTWNVATGLTLGGRVEVAYAPSAASTTYASVENGNGELWKSTDGGQSYALMNSATGYLGGQGWYDNVVWVSPTDANFAIVGGIDLWKTINGGTTLTKISNWQMGGGYGPSAHADQHVITAHPSYNGTSNTTVFFGNDGGIYRAADVTTVGNNPPDYTAGWLELNNNLGVTQFYGAAGNATSGKIVGGTQDNGTPVYTGSTETWADMFGGDGGWCAADPSNVNYLYGEYVFLQIHRSSNGGVFSDKIDGQYWNGSMYVWKPLPYKIPDAEVNQANFIAPFILDPNEPQRILAGGWSLWRTNDARTANTSTTGPSWAAIKGPISGNSPISAIAVAPGNSSIVWVGHNNGNVYKAIDGTNATPTWTQVDTNPTALPNRKVTRITIDPTNANVVYVTFGGFSADSVYRSTDGGSTWADRTGSGATGLPDIPIRTLVIHPDNSQWLYVGGESGLFTSEDAGATWQVPHDGPANVSVDELFFLNNASRELVAATHGRGVYKQATSGAPVLDLTPTSVAFGTVNVGSSSDRTVTVKNVGTGTLAGSGMATGTGFSVVGTASYSLTANQTAVLTVRFAPTSAGSASGSLTLTGGGGATVPLGGTGAAVSPTLTIVGSTTVAPGAAVQVQVANGPGFTKDWVGLHTTAAADNVYSDWKYLNGTRTAPTTPLTAATLTFTMPATAGTYNFRFFQNNTFTKLATSPTVTVGTTSPVLGVNPTSLAFGDVTTGQTLDKTVTVTNTGGGTLSGTGTVTGTGYSLIGTGTYSLTAGQQATLTVRFAPTAVGSATGNLTLTGGAGATVPLTGNGTSSSGPSLTLVGGVTTVAPGATVQVQVSNGPGFLKDWVGLHTTASADNVYLDWKYLNGTRTVPTTAATSATLTFTMPTTTGTYNFRFFQNGGYTKLATSPTVTVGTTGPVLGVNPTSLAFGDVTTGQTLDKAVTVTNTGGGTLSGAGTVTGTGYSLIGTGTYSLTAGQQATLTVRFAPMVAGSATGNLTLTGAAGATVPLTGNGVAPGGPSLTIVGGVTTVAPGATVQVQVSSGPGFTKDWVGLHTTAAADNVYLDWKYLNGTRTVPTTAATSATLTFTMPTTTGTYNFRFFQNGGFTKLATSPTVTVGTGSNPVLGVNPTSLAFGDVTTGQTLDKTVTVTNTGGGTLSGTGTVTGTGYTLIGTGTYSLTAGQQATLTVRFAPTVAGSSTGNLTLTGGAGATVPLTGSGTSGSGPSLTIVGGVTTVAPGATVQVQVSNGPGFTRDWVGLHTTAAADNVYLDWKYLNGTRTAPTTALTSATLTFTMPTAAGTYNFRFFQNGGFTKLTTSATVTVQ